MLVVVALLLLVLVLTTTALGGHLQNLITEAKATRFLVQEIKTMIETRAEVDHNVIADGVSAGLRGEILTVQIHNPAAEE